MPFDRAARRHRPRRRLSCLRRFRVAHRRAPHGIGRSPVSGAARHRPLAPATFWEENQDHRSKLIGSRPCHGKSGTLAFLQIESREAERDARAERALLHLIVVCGPAPDIPHLRLKAATKPGCRPLQARFYIIFQVTNDELRHVDPAIFDIKISIMAGRSCAVVDRTLAGARAGRPRFNPHTFVRLRMRNVS